MDREGLMLFILLKHEGICRKHSSRRRFLSEKYTVADRYTRHKRGLLHSWSVWKPLPIRSSCKYCCSVSLNLFRCRHRHHRLHVMYQLDSPRRLGLLLWPKWKECQHPQRRLLWRQQLGVASVNRGGVQVVVYSKIVVIKGLSAVVVGPAVLYRCYPPVVENKGFQLANRHRINMKKTGVWKNGPRLG